jgi:hypothetical protein
MRGNGVADLALRPLQSSCGTPSIWDSYKDTWAAASKSYGSWWHIVQQIAGSWGIVDAHQQRPDNSPAFHTGGRVSFCRSSKMMDVIMLAIGLGFFVLSVGYCYACDRL